MQFCGSDFFMFSELNIDFLLCPLRPKVEKHAWQPGYSVAKEKVGED